ncbi:PadR family transcriptional regulator [Haloarcula japonica]|uniref:PadR family transcriptional regulator n=1 Tax=Haloarcula japonica TaxID=29282 RepID=UPI0039F69F87
MTTHYALTGFQRDLLEAIAAVDDDPYGLALKDYLDERYADPINHSRLYQNLDQLTNDDLITREELDARTNVYTLTNAGTQLLQHQTETLAGLCDLPQPVVGGDPQ